MRSVCYQRLGFATLLLSAALLPAGAAATPSAAKTCAVTFRIQVPQSTTGKVYLSGSIPALGPWAADKVAMTGTGATRTAVVKIPDGTALQFKFTRGAWSSVESQTGGADVDNRTFTVPDKPTATYTGTVAAWHDTATASPAAGK